MVAAEEAFTHIKRMHDEHGLLQNCLLDFVVWVTGMWCGLQECGFNTSSACTTNMVCVTKLSFGLCGLQGCGVGYRDVVLTN